MPCMIMRGSHWKGWGRGRHAGRGGVVGFDRRRTAVKSDPRCIAAFPDVGLRTLSGDRAGWAPRPHRGARTPRRGARGQTRAPTNPGARDLR